MGIHDLWKILELVKRKEELSSLQGKKLCVDLSCWICEAQVLHSVKAALMHYIESPGEGETLCAWLDLLKHVDGCITSDGDVFLYGTRNVYRDVSISGKEPSVDCYRIEDLESQLILSRENLVGLAVLLGCDYLPQGVPAVGKEKAMKLIQNIKPDNLIERFHKWTTMEMISDQDLSSIKKSIKCKALSDERFPHPKVTQEYLQEPKVSQQFSFKTFCPDIQKLQSMFQPTEEKVIVITDN